LKVVVVVVVGNMWWNQKGIHYYMLEEVEGRRGVLHWVGWVLGKGEEGNALKQGGHRWAQTMMMES